MQHGEKERSMEKKTGARLWPLDALRGLAMVNMVAYHGMYDWVYVFGQKSAWYDIFSPACHVWQQYICWSFLLLAGYSFTLSRRPVKNGLVVAGCALVLTAVTVGFLPSEAIWFGVLHLVGCAILLCCAARPLLEKIPPLAGLAGAAAVFLLTNQLPSGYLGFEGWHLWRVPEELYKANLFWLGLPDLTKFSSADYFPLLPWLFLFLCGYFVGRLRPALPQGRAPAVLRPLCFAGRHSLLVYMLHQPVLYGGLWILFNL